MARNHRTETKTYYHSTRVMQGCVRKLYRSMVGYHSIFILCLLNNKDRMIS